VHPLRGVLKRNPMKKRENQRLKILFLCTGNSCRSQMAEGWARHLKGNLIDPYSAGIENHGLDPNAVIVMQEAGVDISGHRSKTLEDLAGIEFDYVVTVCDRARESCPHLSRKNKSDPPQLR
jgi:arsenate reductase